MLALYSAEDDDAVESYVDKWGNKKYTLKDATKLELLFILKGSYLDSANNPFQMLESKISGELQKVGNGFRTPSLNGYNRVCLIPFTDYGTSSQSLGTGFKLKAGNKHNIQYSNYDYINETGEFWVHKYPETSSSPWRSVNTLYLRYDYYLSTANVDYEKGIVSFSERQDYPVLFTGSNYVYQSCNKKTGESTCLLPFSYFDENNIITSFFATQDDFVDYYEPSYYVNPFDISSQIGTLYNYNETGLRKGKLSQGFIINKDCGYISFTDENNIPRGRILTDYMYHTYYRLTSDGYGDLYFYGTGVLVPATSTATYKDYAAVDLKIVNEGDNTLNNGTLQFLARGYVTSNNVIDTVLDNNRPWDVQKGSTAETVQRTGAACSKSYNSLPTRDSRINAYNKSQSQTCVFGTLEPQQHTYVRVWWCIASNANGTAWVQVTKGAKTYSSEISGTYTIFS